MLQVEVGYPRTWGLKALMETQGGRNTQGENKVCFTLCMFYLSPLNVGKLIGTTEKSPNKFKSLKN